MLNRSAYSRRESNPCVWLAGYIRTDLSLKLYLTLCAGLFEAWKILVVPKLPSHWRLWYCSFKIADILWVIDKTWATSGPFHVEVIIEIIIHVHETLMNLHDDIKHDIQCTWFRQVLCHGMEKVVLHFKCIKSTKVFKITFAKSLIEDEFKKFNLICQICNLSEALKQYDSDKNQFQQF